MNRGLLGIAIVTLIFLYECNPEQLPQLPKDVRQKIEDQIQKPPTVLDQRMTYLISWIAERTNYQPVAIPKVQFMSTQSINNMYRNTAFYGSVFAYYDPKNKTVVLPTNYTAQLHEANLVHELVHHLQFAHNRQFKCSKEREAEAYQIQALYARETGKGQMPSGANIYATCP